MKVDILIVGAGFAGASTAYHLSRTFQGTIAVVDKECVPGFHASGRNASLVLQSVGNAELRRQLAASRVAYQRLGGKIDFRASGSLLLGRSEQLEPLRETDLIPSEYRDREWVFRHIPLLENHPFESALYTPSDGVMDISRLLNFYLEESRVKGVQLMLDCEVRTIEREPQFKVSTAKGTIEAGCLVDAAGAWANRIGELAGAESLTLTAYKRHLFILQHIEHIDPEWPFVWNLEKNFYFRPEPGGLLFSICDETPQQKNFYPTVDENIGEALAELICRELPPLTGAIQKHVWSCFRTKVWGENFRVGWSSQLEHFFWVAGLGGHGMGCSWEIGRQASQAILSRGVSERGGGNARASKACE